MVHKYPSGKQVFYISLLEVTLFSLKGKIFFLGRKIYFYSMEKNNRKTVFYFSHTTESEYICKTTAASQKGAAVDVFI
jgi:hypothetical protein